MPENIVVRAFSNFDGEGSEGVKICECCIKIKCGFTSKIPLRIIISKRDVLKIYIVIK